MEALIDWLSFTVLKEMTERTKQMTFIKCMKDFFEYLLSIGRSKKTISTYEQQLKKYYRYLITKKNREIYIHEFTSDDFKEYLKDENIDLSSQSKRVLITGFKSFMSYCLKKDYAKQT